MTIGDYTYCLLELGFGMALFPPPLLPHGQVILEILRPSDR